MEYALDGKKGLVEAVTVWTLDLTIFPLYIEGTYACAALTDDQDHTGKREKQTQRPLRVLKRLTYSSEYTSGHTWNLHPIKPAIHLY